MSLFGTSREDEERIRKALASEDKTQLPNSQLTLSFAHLLAYETASEHDLVEAPEKAPVGVSKQEARDDVTIITDAAHRKSLETIDHQTPASHTTRAVNLQDLEEAEVYAPDSEALHTELLRILRTETLERRISRARLDLELHKSHEDEEDEGVALEDLNWDSPSDPENPQNWSNFKKWFITMSTAGVALVVTFGLSLYTTGISDMVIRGLGSQELCISGLTFYVLGLSFGPMIAAPISELFGRRIVYLVTFPISLIFTLGVGFSHHIREILVLRFFAGLVGSPALAVCSGTISDMWGLDEIEVAMSFFCMAPFCGPIIGPVIGGFAVESKSWKWTSWIDLFFGAALLPFLALCPETYKPVLLKRRAKERGIKIAKSNVSLKKMIVTIIQLFVLKPLIMLVVEPIVLLFLIWSAFIFAVLFGFFEAYPVIFRGLYGMSLGVSGLPFIGIGIGLFIGMLLYLWLVKRVFWKKNPDGSLPLFKNGVFTPPVPESRLLPAKIGAIFLPIGLFWVGWSAHKDVHWMVPIVGGLPFGFGLVLIFFSTITYFSLSYPAASLASAIAANNFLRYILASVFPLFTVQMYENVHIGWASSIFAFIALVMVPIPWVFEKYGPKIRQTSRYGYAAVAKAKAEREQKLNAESKELESLEKKLTHQDAASQV